MKFVSCSCNKDNPIIDLTTVRTIDKERGAIKFYYKKEFAGKEGPSFWHYSTFDPAEEAYENLKKQINTMQEG